MATDRELLTSIRAQIDVHLAPPPGPAPVDCVLSEWGAFGPWSPWIADPVTNTGVATETRSRERTKTILVEPAHGGADCGPLVDVETETRPLEWTLQSAGPWSSCQPDGTQHRSEVWVRGMETETRVGHQPCVYVPPSGGVISYRVEMFDGPGRIHTHFFTEVSEMKSWIAAWTGPDGPASLFYRDYDRVDHVETHATLTAFKAFIAGFVPPVPPIITPVPGELTFPGQASWRDVWPDYNPLDLSQAPGGLTTGDGFSEPRAFAEGQWWFSPTGLIRNMRHVHCGAAVPKKARGVFDIFVRLRSFHWHEMPGVVLRGLYSFGIFEPGVRVMAPAPLSERLPAIINTPAAQHLTDVWIPIRIDSRGSVTDGWKALVLRAQLVRPAKPGFDQIDHLVTVRIPIYLDNGGGREVTKGGDSGSFMCSGWMTEWLRDPLSDMKQEINNFGYVEPSIFRWDPANTGPDAPEFNVKRFVDDPETFWTVRGSGLMPLDLVVTKNPDFHLHPKYDGTPEDNALITKFNGQVMVDKSIASSKLGTTKVSAAGFVSGDRMVTRILDMKSPRYEYVTQADGSRKLVRLIEGQETAGGTPVPTHDPPSSAGSLLVVTLK